MKKGLKLFPFALAALMLVGCSSRPIGPANGNDQIFNENTMSYQEFYDEMYSKHNGSQDAAKELIFQVAKKVVNESETFKKLDGGVNGLIESRRNDVLDGFYTSTYKKNGLFKEELLVEDLTNKGYELKLKENKTGFYEETFEDGKKGLLGYNDLHDKLNYDYSEYLEKEADYDIYLQLLKEEYILTEKSKYFDDKRIRKVQFFKYTPDTPSKADEIQGKIENIIENELKAKGDISSKRFEELSQTSFQDAVDAASLDKVAKEYAIINDAPKSEAELKYKDKYLLDAYIDEITGVTEKKLSDKQKDDVVSAYNSYTNNGAYNKETGYELKQIDAYNKLGYKEGFISSDDNSSTLVQSDIDTLIKKNHDQLEKNKIVFNDKTTSLLDATGSGATVFKKDSSYFVVRVEEITNKTEGIDYVLGAKALTKNTTNVKNAVAHYLEKCEVNIYEETLYNYLKDTFGFDKEKK